MDRLSLILSITASFATIYSILVTFPASANRINITIGGSRRNQHPWIPSLSLLITGYIVIHYFGISSNELNKVLFNHQFSSGSVIKPDGGDALIFIGIILLYSDIVRSGIYKRRRKKENHILMSTILVFVLSAILLFTTYWAGNTTFLLLVSMSFINIFTWLRAYH